ncbi:methionine gamma-lyase family protein, partial [Agathobacter rectalis]|uniref:methionine gamma-lyase family protein n=1 Tax=Agathobacter rectalis TaxID=39491 RepID=UPI0027D32D28
SAESSMDEPCTNAPAADGPVKPPYAVYFQGGLTWYHAKLGILMSLQKLYERNLVKLD